jgi:hypothetical protein
MTRKNILSLAAAAAISAGGLAYAADDAKITANRAADKTERAAERAGDKIERGADNVKGAAKDAAASWNVGRIHTMLTQVTEASLTKGGFNDVVERLVDADRNRIGKWTKDDANKAALDKLDGRIAQFQKDWKAKYGSDFDIKNDAQVFGTQQFQYAMGEIGEDAQVAGKKLPAGENVTADNLDKKVDKAGNTVADKNLEKGRNVGYVTVKESHGMPELKVPLVHELPNNWRIDIPDNIDGQKLYDNLLKHLTMANEQKDQWPADVNEGYRAVAHHVLMALLDVEKDARQAGAKLGADTATKSEDK